MNSRRPGPGLTAGTLEVGVQADSEPDSGFGVRDRDSRAADSAGSDSVPESQLRARPVQVRPPRAAEAAARRRGSRGGSSSQNSRADSDSL